jgi:RNA polymerase sigma-70 factor, ECF subfamily
MELARPRGPEAEALCRDHGRALRAYVGARVRDRGRVEDLCQETFLVALDRGVPPDGVGRWLFAIARNKVLKLMRDTRPTATALHEPPGREQPPLASLQARETREGVQVAVRGLPADLEEVIRLRYEGGLDYRGIADHLDLPLSTVQGRLKRARQALRQALLPGPSQPADQGGEP